AAPAPGPPCAPELAAQARCPTLSGYGLFTTVHSAGLVPAAGTVAYEVISPLFSDFAAKHRHFRLPPGATIGYDAEGAWRFPVGTVVAKTFEWPVDQRAPARGVRRVETRIAVQTATGFVAATYVWDDTQTDARLVTDGTTVDVAWIDRDGTER